MNSDVTERARGIIPEYAQLLSTNSMGSFSFLFFVLFQGSVEVGMIKTLMFQSSQNMEDLMLNSRVLKKDIY